MGSPLGQLTITRSSPESITSTASVSNHVAAKEQEHELPMAPWENDMEWKVERTGQFGIPILFLLFNIAYWSGYMS